ncbi:MAG: hypothetical protein HZA16_01940 [Nitrospirae bacterium]|nr:hypothetical protein [Nitrospirota bacterium]
MKRISVVYAFLLMAAASMVLPGAADAVLVEGDIYLTAQSFQWKELNSAGAQLLKESGPLYGAGGSAKWHLKSVTLKAGGELFGGVIDYDGQTIETRNSPSVPVQTDANYWGYRIEATAGYKFMVAEKASLEPFIGPALKYWERDLKSTDAARGYVEKWTNIYARLGMLGVIRMSNGVNIFAEGGVKVPIYNENRVDLFDITIEPGKEEAYFAELGFKWRLLKTSLFYEGLRFSRSDSELANDGQRYLQPESKGDIIGVKAGVSF